MVRRETFQEQVQRGDIPLRGITKKGRRYDLTVPQGVAFSRPKLLALLILGVAGIWVAVLRLLWSG